ncbi:hypothetical protein POM88_049317 [Heracleum sosnowskyi]|uniref:Uncharacterized protein n=1 Tax=Heracleum sosnowskyi TaxID=360622 RepID=A0AAD8GWP1_9APIA|nr:hypothetical protein POM88_049317 [Heracleum sosnowskyi]
MKTLVYVLFLAALVSNIVYTAQSIGEYKDVTHYQYAITWAPTYCKYLIHDHCVPNLPDRFFMHGIWAGDASGRTVDNCKVEPPIPIDLLKKFEARLSKSWPPIIQGMTAFRLWGHEYRKHGVCLKDWTATNYLNFADRVSLNNNITKLLETNGIKISSTVKYSRGAIEKAIQTKIGAGFSMYLGCQQVGTLYYLKSAAICIKKIDGTKFLNVYEFVSCPQRIDPNYNNCGGGKTEEENIFLL